MPRSSRLGATVDRDFTKIHYKYRYILWGLISWSRQLGPGWAMGLERVD